MRNLVVRSAGALLLLTFLAGCSKLGLGGQPTHSQDLPTAQQLRTIRYMSQTPGPDGRRVFDHLEQAKSCRDLGIAMRWNRPPDVKGGPFNQKMVYVSAHMPANLPKNSEVFVTGTIERGQALPSGSSAWLLKLKDGTELQAIETTGYAQKQEEAQQAGGHPTMVHPYTPGRLLCAYGVYQGATALTADHRHIPMVSVLFSMDRAR